MPLVLGILYLFSLLVQEAPGTGNIQTFLKFLSALLQSSIKKEED